MDDVKLRIEELLLTCSSEAHDCKAGNVDRQREVQNVATLTELLIKQQAEEQRMILEEKRIQIDQDRNDIDSERFRDESSNKVHELEQACRESKRRLICEITKIVLVGTAIPIAMIVDEHAGDLISNRIFKFWSKPKI